MVALDASPRLLPLPLHQLHRRHQSPPSLLLSLLLPRLQIWITVSMSILSWHDVRLLRIALPTLKSESMGWFQAVSDSKLSTMINAQQVVISTVTVLTERMDIFASCLENSVSHCLPEIRRLLRVIRLSSLPDLLPQNIGFALNYQLNFISWNVCGIISHAKLAQLKA